MSTAYDLKIRNEIYHRLVRTHPPYRALDIWWRWSIKNTLIIYRLGCEYPRLENEDQNDYSRPRNPKYALDFLRANKQVFLEATPILYGQHFRFDGQRSLYEFPKAIRGNVIYLKNLQFGIHLTRPPPIILGLPENAPKLLQIFLSHKHQGFRKGYDQFKDNEAEAGTRLAEHIGVVART